MTQAIQRKEKEIAAIAAKMEDEQSLGGKMHKQVKELSVSGLTRDINRNLHLVENSRLEGIMSYHT